MTCSKLLGRLRQHLPAALSQVRGISGGVPPSLFYDLNGNNNRVYFYRLDDRGYLYLEQTLHEVEKKQRDMGRTGSSGRNITVALKDPKFLRFFFSMLKPNPQYRPSDSNSSVSDNGCGEGEEAALANATVAGVDVTRYCSSYPLVSLCGKERNFLLPDDPLASLGFTDLSEEDTGGDGDGDRDGRDALLYAGGQLSEPFLPASLLYHRDSGKLYHSISAHKRLQGRHGILHPHLAQRILGDLSEGEGGGGALTFSWRGRCHELRSF